MINELLSCPFCGGAPHEPFDVGDIGHEQWAINCSEACTVDYSLYANTRDGVIAKWNRRPAPAGAPDDVSAALAECGIGGIFDTFTGPADAIRQMALHIRELEAQRASSAPDVTDEDVERLAHVACQAQREWWRTPGDVSGIEK